MPEMVDFSERKITIGDSSFQLHIEGRGPALLLLHGFTGSIETMAGLSTALRHHFCVISIDLPGHGRTSVPDDSSWYTFSRCNSVLEGILDQLRIEKCLICGYSMGGRMGLLFAANCPSRVAAVVTIGASGGIEVEKDRRLRKEEDEKLAAFIELEGIQSFVQRWMDHPLFASQQKRGQAFLDEAYRQRLGNNPSSLAYSLRGTGTGSQKPVYLDLQELDIPMLFIAGEDDRKFCDLALQLKKNCRDGHTCFIKQAGHAAHLENISVTAEAITLFFRRYGQALTKTPGSKSPLISCLRRNPGVLYFKVNMTLSKTHNAVDRTFYEAILFNE